MLAQHSEVVRVAEQQADQTAAPRPRRRRPRCAGRPTSSSTQRMAGFESVLHKTASQVKTARLRLAERSGLDGSAPSVDARAYAE